MALTVTHPYVSSITETTPSGGPGGTVGPTEWNANHTVAGSITLASSADGITGNLPVTNLNSGTGASTTTMWRGDGSWAAVDLATGNVTGTLSTAHIAAAASGAFGIVKPDNSSITISSGVISSAGGSVTPPATFTLSTSTSTATLLSLVTSTTTGASQYAQQLSITGTWNDSAHTFDAPLFMNITATAQASGSSLIDLQITGASVLKWVKGFSGTAGDDAFVITASTPNSQLWAISPRGGTGIPLYYSGAAGHSFDSSIFIKDGGSHFVRLNCPGVTHVLSLSDGGSNPNTFYVYNTTDSDTGAPTNYERAIFDFGVATANVLTIGTQTGGTGQSRHFQITKQTTSGTTGIYFTSATFTTTSMPAAGNTGARILITDGSSAATFLSTPAGGGSFKAPLYDDGTVWRYG